MNKDLDYASDSDESDEDFQPDILAGESPASEDEADESDVCEENADDTEEAKIKSTNTKKSITKKVTKKKKIKTKIEDDGSQDDNGKGTATSRRATRQTEDLHTNGKRKTLEKDELESEEEDKTRTNALWTDFLKDVNPTAASSKTNKTKSEDKPSSFSSNGKETNEKTDVVNKNQTPKEENKRIVVTEVVDFAGEEVCIQREINASSIKENKAVAVQPAKKLPFSRVMPGSGIKRTIPTAATGSSTGLGSILNQLGKKKKLSVLEKSQMDWKSFKHDEGIDEQLQTFNKGKDGYLERQDFLQRTDLRQFEIEKNLRQTTKRPH